jgi:hypothetical protein
MIAVMQEAALWSWKNWEESHCLSRWTRNKVVPLPEMEQYLGIAPSFSRYSSTSLESLFERIEQQTSLSLECAPQSKEELQDIHRPWLEAYNHLFDVLPSLDLSEVDDFDTPQEVDKTDSYSIYRSLRGEPVPKQSHIRDNSVIADELLSPFPSFSPLSLMPNEESPSLASAVKTNLSFFRLPPRVSFEQLLAIFLLVQHCTRSLMRLLIEFSRVDSVFIEMLLPGELLFCVCRKRYPPLANIDKRMERYSLLRYLSGLWPINSRNLSSAFDVFRSNTVSFATLLYAIYPRRTTSPMFLEEDARNNFPQQYFACFPPSALEQMLRRNLQDDVFFLDSLLNDIGAIPPPDASTDTFFLSSASKYNNVAWARYTGKKREALSFLSDTELLSHALVVYSSREDLVRKVGNIRSGIGRHLYFVRSPQACTNEEDPVTLEDVEKALVIGNAHTNTCVSISTLVELLQEDSKEQYRGLFDPSTEETFDYQEAEEISKLLVRYSDEVGLNPFQARFLAFSLMTFYDKISSVDDLFNNLSPEDRAICRSILESLFRAGMYMRGWKGPGTPYPLREHQTFCAISPETEVAYSSHFAAARRLMESSSSLASLFSSMTVYTIETIGTLQEKNSSLFNLVVSLRQDTCMRILSNELIATTTFFLERFFDTVPSGFDVQELEKTIFSPEERARQE